MNSDTITAALVLIMIGLIGAGFGGYGLGKAVQRDQAISAGVARWTVNPTNGETKLEFIKPHDQ